MPVREVETEDIFEEEEEPEADVVEGVQGYELEEEDEEAYEEEESPYGEDDEESPFTEKDPEEEF